MAPSHERAGWGPIRSLLSLLPLLVFIPWFAVRKLYGNYSTSSPSQSHLRCSFLFLSSQPFRNPLQNCDHVSLLGRIPTITDDLRVLASMQELAFRRFRKLRFSHTSGTSPKTLDTAPSELLNMLSQTNGWSTRLMKSRGNASDWCTWIRGVGWNAKCGINEAVAVIGARL